MEFAKYFSHISNYIFNNWENILCLIGFSYFILARVLGMFPLTTQKKELFDSLLSFLHEELGEHIAPYHFPEDLSEQLRNSYDSPEVLTQIARNILSHCHAASSNLQVKIAPEDLDSAGVFYKNEITINQALQMRKNEVLAVLIHECMHYYLLVVKQIRLEDTLQNEYLTDITALYMGFGEYMNRGYLKVGYLKRNEIRYIRRKLLS